MSSNSPGNSIGPPSRRNGGLRSAIPWLVPLLALSLLPRARAAVTPQIERAVRAATFEVVLRKPARDPLTYEKPLPLDLIPYQQRTDKFQPVGTAFALGPGTYVTAAHVLEAAVNSQYGAPALRGEDDKVYPVASILRFSADEDYAVFTLAGAPVPSPLDVSRTPSLDEPVFAVGTALGEGIVIRDGLYTSATPEDQDGRWKWIRFSAAASPGNSGGPLLDQRGNVIGVIIAKSPNENLNYALPIGIVLDAPAKGIFDRRFLTAFPFMQASRVYTLKDEFTLPLSWTAFEHEYERVIERHSDEARNQLLAASAASMFPHGDGSDSILYSPPTPDPDPGIILQQQNGEWTLDKPAVDSTDLPGNGRISVASIAGATLLRMERGDNASDDAFYSDSKRFMDVALKGLVIRRLVGSDAVRVTSLGPALSDRLWTDRYGRKWQQRVWALPYLDSYLVALLLPTPDGYVALLQCISSSARDQAKESLALLANQVYLSYRGTLPQWMAFLRRRALLPDAFAHVSLRAAPTWSLRTPRFEMALPTTPGGPGPDARLCLVMAYDAGTPRDSWNIAGAWWYQDAEQKNYLALWRQPRPPAAARQALQDAYADMQNGVSPYDGRPIRVSGSSIGLTTVLQAPGAKPHTASAGVLYVLAIGAESDTAIASISEEEDVATSSIHILERGIGADVAVAAPAPDLKSRLDGYMQQYVQVAIKYDKIYGPDMRGRTYSQDVVDYMSAPFHKAVLETGGSASASLQPRGTGSFDQLGPEIVSRMHALQDYWKLVPGMTHNRDLWPAFLARNGMPRDLRHEASVLAAEAALRQELAQGNPNPRWAQLASTLSNAYVAERNRLVMTAAANSSAALQPRSTPCPPDAPRTSGNRLPALQPLTSSLAEFYPAQMRRLGIAGRVVVEIWIDVHGCVAKRTVVGSSGSDALDQAALQWIETASYLPAERDGHAIPYVGNQIVNFTLGH